MPHHFQTVTALSLILPLLSSSFLSSSTPLFTQRQIDQHQSLTAHAAKLTSTNEDDHNSSPPRVLNRRSALLQIATLFALPSPIIAAIPTIDDYDNTSTGYKQLKPSSTSSTSQRVLEALSLKTPLNNGKSSAVTFSESLAMSLNAMDDIVSSADWAGVRSVLRGEGRYEGNVLSVVRKSYFGTKGGEKGFKKIWQGDVAGLEDARQDIASSLAELEDFALENRAVFFNSVDRKEVDELIAESGFTENVAEGKRLYAVAKIAALDFRSAVNKL